MIEDQEKLPRQQEMKDTKLGSVKISELQGNINREDNNNVQSYLLRSKTSRPTSPAYAPKLHMHQNVENK